MAELAAALVADLDRAADELANARVALEASEHRALEPAVGCEAVDDGFDVASVERRRVAHEEAVHVEPVGERSPVIHCGGKHADRIAVEPGERVLDVLLVEHAVHLHDAVAEVRRQHGVGARDERMIGRQRLALVHVERRDDAALASRRDQAPAPRSAARATCSRGSRRASSARCPRRGSRRACGRTGRDGGSRRRLARAARPCRHAARPPRRRARRSGSGSTRGRSFRAHGRSAPSARRCGRGRRGPASCPTSTKPVGVSSWKRPARVDASPCGMRRAAASISASASSAVLSTPGPPSVNADEDAALLHAREIDLAGAMAREPEHLELRQPGDERHAGKACARACTGSRRSPRARCAASASEANGSSKNTTSARACRRDQSAQSRATRCQSSRTAMRIMAYAAIRKSRTRCIAMSRSSTPFHGISTSTSGALRDVVGAVGRVDHVVAGHEQHRDRAVAHELARDAEDEVAAEHALAKALELRRVDVRPVAHFVGPLVELGVERRAIDVRQADRVLQHERRNGVGPALRRPTVRTTRRCTRRTRGSA